MAGTKTNLHEVVTPRASPIVGGKIVLTLVFGKLGAVVGMKGDLPGNLVGTCVLPFDGLDVIECTPVAFRTANAKDLGTNSL